MKKAFLATVLFCTFYSLQIVFQQTFVRGAIQPLHLNFLTNSLGALVLFGYFYIFNRKSLVIIPAKSVSGKFYLALASWIIADFLSVYGLKFSSSVNFSIITRTMIFSTFILSVIFLQEKIIFNKVVATLISFFGVLLVIYNFKTRINFNPGDIFFLGTVLTLSISNISRQKIANRLSALQLSLLLYGYAAVILGLIVLFIYPITYLLPYKFIIFNTITGLTGFILVNYAIQKGGAVFFTLVANLLPFFTIIFSFIFFNQKPLVTQILGGVMIFISIFIFQKKFTAKN